MTGLISSDPAVATVTHGLTDLGRKQAAAAVAELAESGNRKLAIFTSDFTRCVTHLCVLERFCKGLWVPDSSA
eukprot:SAG31_NODE_2833_length_5023_cov_2.514216_4_plen_73_part_00